MNQKPKITCKDICLIIIFSGLVLSDIILSIYKNGFSNVSVLIEQTLLLMLSFVGLVQIASYQGWSILVPDFYEFAQKRKYMHEMDSFLKAYFQEDINFLRDYDEERVSFLLSQLGINVSQLDEIRLELIRMRCLPLKSLEDAKEKIKYLVKGSYPIIINQNKVDSSKLCYNKVKYYINITDMMFLDDYAREFSSILTFLISKNIELSSFDKLVIPYDSNFLLGVEVGKKLGKSVVKMRLKKGKIETKKIWEGNLKPKDKVIIIHDVLVSGDQILDTITKLPDTCQILGLYCLIVRKEWDGKKRLFNEGIPVHQVIELNDKDIHNIRGDR